MTRIVSRCSLVLGVFVVGLLLTHGLQFNHHSVAQPTVEQQQQQQQQQQRALATVRDFGAVGDGIADDTAAIQRCINSETGEIRFPPGVYRISATVEIPLDKVGPTSLVADGAATVIMAGPGPAFRIRGTHQGTASPHTVEDNVWNRQRTPLVDGLEIRGAHAEASGIEASGTMQIVFSRVTVRHALHGIHLVKRNRNVIVTDCHLYDNRGVGLYLDGLNLHQINVIGSHISYNDAGGIVVKNSEIRNLHIGTCDIEGNMGVDGPPTANILLDATNGTVREGSIVGCTIQHNHEAPNSANIRFIGNSAEQPQKVGHFTIGDNALSDVAVNIDLKYARGVTIVNNTLWKAFEHNLLVDGCSDIVVGPNLLDRNPDYRPNDSPNGVLFRNSSDCSINGLHLNHTLETPSGLVLTDCRWFNITNCTILDCDGGGILFHNVFDSRISDCLIRDNRADAQQDAVLIRVTGGGGNQIIDNKVAGRIEAAAASNMLQGNLQAK